MNKRSPNPLCTRWALYKLTPVKRSLGFKQIAGGTASGRRHNQMVRKISRYFAAAFVSLGAVSLGGSASSASTVPVPQSHIRYESKDHIRFSPTSSPTGNFYAPLFQEGVEAAGISGVFETKTQGATTVWSNSSIYNRSTTSNLTITLTACKQTKCDYEQIGVLAPATATLPSQLDLLLGEKLPAKTTSYVVRFTLNDGSSAWFDLLSRTGSAH